MAFGVGSAIEVEDLVKVYRSGGRTKAALEGVSFTVDRGEIFGLLGPNGSGKTTAARILVTLLAKTSGVARVGGFDTDRQADRIREVIGYAGQFTGIDDDLTVHENLVIQGLLHGISVGTETARLEARKRIAELLDVFTLDQIADQRAGRLSGGLRRRLDLAQALMHRPAVLFLDEPTTGLDPQSRNALWNYLRYLSGEGTAVFLTTQYLEEADRVCDRVAIIDQGRLVRSGTPEVLKAEIGGGRLVLTLGPGDTAAGAAAVLSGCPGVTRVEPGDHLAVYVRDVAAGIVPVLQWLHDAGIQVASVEQARATLDDVFLHYTGHRPRNEAPTTASVSSIFAAAHGRRAR